MDVSPARLALPGRWDWAFRAPDRARVEAALTRHAAGRRWFGGKARRVERSEIVDAVPVGAGQDAPRIALLRLWYAEGAAEVYAIPLAFAPGARADEVRAAFPGTEVALIEAEGETGLLYAADRDPAFARAL